MVGTPLIADVRLAERLDGVELLARNGDTHALCRELRRILPGQRVRRSSVGAWIEAANAEVLTTIEDDALDLRWADEARRFADNRQRARGAHDQLRTEVLGIVEGGRDAARAALADARGLDPLDDHQLVNVAAMTLPGGCGLCIFDEQGAGKTVTLIFAFDVLVSRDEVDFALILAPKSMVPEWPRDFERFKHDLYRVQIASGTRREKRSALRSQFDVLVTNFETAVSLEDELRALLRRHQGRAMLVVDESFYAKNLDAKRTRAIRRLREWCGRAFVLCGTPAPNSPGDLVQQFNLVDFGLTFDGVEIPEDRQQALPIVQAQVESRGLFVRHLKKDVLPELPGKTFQRVLVSMQPDQERAYRAALDDLVLDLQATDDSSFRRELTSFLARRSALLQICSNPAALVPGYEEVPAKLLALESILEELVGARGEKVVVWSFFTASIDAIIRRFSRLDPLRYDGTVSDVEARREAVRAFQEDEGRKLFVANPAAAGAGLTLHSARFAIYESMSNQAAHYLQSLDRIHRRGQDRPVEYIVLLCDRAIDIAEYDTLTHKEAAAQQLLRDDVEAPVTRQSFLEDALRIRELIGGDQR